MTAATDARDTVFDSLLVMKRAMDDGLDCEFHVKVSGPKSLAKAQEEIATLRARVKELEDELAIAQTMLEEACLALRRIEKNGMQMMRRRMVSIAKTALSRLTVKKDSIR